MEVVLEGTEGPDRLFGGSAPERIIGLGGDDTISGGLGVDTMSGGAGVDTIDFDYTGADVDINLETGRALFFNGVLERIFSFENVVGSTGNNLITGSDDDNVLYGNEGNDTLIGGLGIDSFDGGAGIDTVDFSYTSADVDIDLAIDGGFGTGRATFANGAVEVIENVERVIGTNGSNDISAEFLFTGPTRIDALGGDDTINGTVFGDELIGGSGDDRIFGNGGADTMLGGSGDDTIFSGEDGEFVVIDGGSGNDFISVNGEGNTVFGGDGNDNIEASPGQSDAGGRDTLDGGAGNDTIRAGSDEDVIIGGDGNDVLFGAGDEFLADLGSSNDTLTGGEGADTFVFDTDTEFDRITDFTQGEDVIDVSVFADTFEELDISQTAEGTLIFLREADPIDGFEDDQVLLENFFDTLTEDDFLL